MPPSTSRPTTSRSSTCTSWLRIPTSSTGYGRNYRLTKRIAEEIGFKLKKEVGVVPMGTEGTAAGDSILLDYADIVVHVFTPEAREFYRLDVLWKQAPVESVE